MIPTGDWLAARAASSPAATALVDAHGNRTRTFDALDDAVDRTAGRLAAFGVGPGDHVGVLAETRPAFARLAFAAPRLGAVLVPLNARLSEPELDRQHSAGDVDLLVHSRETADAATAIADGAVASVDGDESSALADRAPAAFDPSPPAPEDPQVLAFTSGTTGSPKPVVLTAGNLRASAVASAFRLGVDPDDRWLCPLPMYHVGGLSVVLRSTLYGTAAVLHRGFEAASVRDVLATHDCTGVSVVPTMLRRLLDDGPLPDALRFVLVGGAPTPPDLVERCADAGVPVCPTYGLTETASQVATARPGEAAADPDTVGRPLAFADVTVVDDAGDPLPTEETGEIVVDGPTVAPGYYGDADATDHAFGPHGLHTGDVGYSDASGRLYVVDRLDDRVVTGGENVYPGEVAAAIRSHPGVEDVAVVGLADDEWGERIAALVVPDDAAAGPDAADVRAHCESRLAGFKHPRTVGFADVLPRTASGTVDRDAVRARLRDADEHF